jgi:hypothetical protein
MAAITEVPRHETLDRTSHVGAREEHDGPIDGEGSTSDSNSEFTKAEWVTRAAVEGMEPAFMAKVEVLNAAIKEIGMGRYQYELFFTAGMSFLLQTSLKEQASCLFSC